MGDCLSPGMTIGTCAWMEDEWMKTIDAKSKRYFRAKRFMDDILLMYVRTPEFDSRRFVQDMQRSVVYQEPLKLEAGHDGTFLETRYAITENRMRYWLKNDNEDGKVAVWRYHHWCSNAPFAQKRATVTACLRKVHRMSSSPAYLIKGAMDKAAEFRRLRYPPAVLYKACAVLGATTGEGAWIRVRDELRRMGTVQRPVGD